RVTAILSGSGILTANNIIGFYNPIKSNFVFWRLGIFCQTDSLQFVSFIYFNNCKMDDSEYNHRFYIAKFGRAPPELMGSSNKKIRDVYMKRRHNYRVMKIIEKNEEIEILQYNNSRKISTITPVEGVALPDNEPLVEGTHYTKEKKKVDNWVRVLKKVCNVMKL